MSLIDSLLIAVLAIIVPIASYVSFNRLLRRIADGEPVDRKAIFQSSTISQWVLFVITIGAWMYQDRSFETLGFQLTIDSTFYLAIGLTAACFIYLTMQLRQAMNPNAEDLQNLRSQHGRLEALFPRNGNELGRFYLLSLTAGIVEETLWRGFMIWALSQVMPLWMAATISVVGFGICHAYQGMANVPMVTLVGAILTVLFLLTGSLLLPMILHAGVDMMMGRSVFEMLRFDDNNAPTGSDPGMPTPS
jgi:membrane protease YdiL (CAAX protease family)